MIFNVFVKFFSASIAVFATILAEYLFIQLVTFRMQVITLVVGMVFIAMVVLLSGMVKFTISHTQPHNSF